MVKEKAAGEKRRAGHQGDKHLKEEALILDITVPTPVADDRYNAMKSGYPEIGSFLWSLPEYAGDREVYCRFRIEAFGTDVIVPGLNSKSFGTMVMPTYRATLEATEISLIRLPRVYEILNEALIAQAREREKKWQFLESSESRVYNWTLEAARVRTALADLGTKIIEKRALRTRTGCGFMALAQANPNLNRREVGVGLELAKEILRDLRRMEMRLYGKHSGRFETVSDIAGVKLELLVRFPATTSFSVRLDMHLVLCGRGRCVYVNPHVLKCEMEGDVDGDLLFARIDDRLIKRAVTETQVTVPLRITPNNFVGDYSLGDVRHLEKVDDVKVFLGMAGKEGIGEITNLFYRGMLVIHAVYQYAPEMRGLFWQHVNRPEIACYQVEGPNEPANRRSFRHLSARALMDSFTAFYEGTFDLRKDDSIRAYLEHLLRAIRGQEPIDFGILSRMEWKGRPVDVIPMAVLWDAARVDDRAGRVAQFIANRPILDLFFKGRGVTWAKRELLETIVAEFDTPDLAGFIFDELSGFHHTEVSPKAAPDD